MWLSHVLMVERTVLLLRKVLSNVICKENKLLYGFDGQLWGNSPAHAICHNLLCPVDGNTMTPPHTHTYIHHPRNVLAVWSLAPSHWKPLDGTPPGYRYEVFLCRTRTHKMSNVIRPLLFFQVALPSLQYSTIVQAYGQLPPLLACQTSRGWGTSIRKEQDVTNYDTTALQFVCVSSTLLSYGLRFHRTFKWLLVQVGSGVVTWTPKCVI